MAFINPNKLMCWWRFPGAKLVCCSFFSLFVAGCDSGPRPPSPDTQALAICQTQNSGIKKQLQEANVQLEKAKGKIVELETAKSSADYKSIIMLSVSALTFLVGVGLGSSAKREAKSNRDKTID